MKTERMTEFSVKASWTDSWIRILLVLKEFKYTFIFSLSQRVECHKYLCSSNVICFRDDSGYPHDVRADKNPYPHERRADKDSYPTTATISALS